MSPQAIDQSWGFADPAKIKAAGVQVVSMYLSNDPSKNMTAAKVKAYHQVGIGVLFNWEGIAGAPLGGHAQGSTDAATAVRLARDIIAAVGYAPRNRPIIYFSCDTDVNASQFPRIDEYYATAGDICHAADFGVGAYGEASLVSHLAASHITDGEWQTIAWSNGVLSPDADFYQTSVNDTLGGASVDFDRIIHPAQLGAWWPPGSPHDTGEEAPVTPAEIDTIVNQVFHHPLDGQGTTFAQYVRQIRAAQDPAAIAAAVVAKLPAGSPASQATIEAAVRAVFADAGTAP